MPSAEKKCNEGLTHFTISKIMNTFTLCSVNITPISREELHNVIATAINTSAHQTILHVNAHAINLAQHDRSFRNILNSASLVFCDGFGVRLGAYILGYRIPPRITYADWMWQLAEFAEQNRFTLFLLGAKPGVAELAARTLQTRFPELQIVGTHHGYFDKSPSSSENEVIINRINQLAPDILIVCFGMPQQEQWLFTYRKHIDAHVALTGGAMLDYISGNLRRGPQWMTDYGLEWLARLIIEPRRLWRRYIWGNPYFLWLVLKQRLGVSQLNQHNG